MMQFYAMRNGGLEPIESTNPPADIFGKATWIDLNAPTAEEEAFVEKGLGLNIPTREEMRNIEESARLYEETGALFMTAVAISGISQKNPARTEVSFVVTQKHLVTVRYADLLPFATFEQKCSRQPEAHTTSDLLFTSLIEQVLQRIADVLETVTTDLDDIAGHLFEEEGKKGKGKTVKAKNVQQVSNMLQATVKRLGRLSALLSKLRESLLSFNRLLAFFRQNAASWLEDTSKAKIKSLDRDVQSLTEYESHLVSQISYLQEATFNLISIEQNRVIKVFTIVPVLFLPPTLIGTIYGMNFASMPELQWTLGYPFALLLIVLSAVVSYLWFKRSGWL
jgi:magnesium transporter